ncbi:hypothetical protein GIB67_038320 [Kingdonia uniflora]|uniref:Cyclin-L2 n=1 Tax=Kingdonia uniflora TaxID=39325 RepID=A0A7J7KUJ0_9MAGN|nr:hypothetical protein GIB67_038320 [Kingdonia uniflora]
MYSLRTTLCVRFKSEVVACGVVYAAARRFSVPLPENPPWWIAFDADKSAIDEVCRVLAHLYSLPKAHHIPVCKSGGSHTLSNKTQDSGAQRGLKEGSVNDVAVKLDTSTPMAPSSVAYLDSSDSKDPLIKLAMEKLKESKKIDGDTKSGLIEEDNKEVPVGKLKSDHKTSVGGERSNRERDKDKKPRDRDRGKDFDREREGEKDRDIIHKERSHRSKDKGKDTGHSEKSRHHHSRDGTMNENENEILLLYLSDYDEYQGSSYSSREKDQRHRHHPY